MLGRFPTDSAREPLRFLDDVGPHGSVPNRDLPDVQRHESHDGERQKAANRQAHGASGESGDEEPSTFSVALGAGPLY